MAASVATAIAAILPALDHLICLPAMPPLRAPPAEVLPYSRASL